MENDPGARPLASQAGKKNTTEPRCQAVWPHDDRGGIAPFRRLRGQLRLLFLRTRDRPPPPDPPGRSVISLGSRNSKKKKSRRRLSVAFAELALSAYSNAICMRRGDAGRANGPRSLTTRGDAPSGRRGGRLPGDFLPVNHAVSG